MNSSQDKVLQYLSEARATENGLARALESHIALSPPGPYRSILEDHLDETHEHALQVDRRLKALGPVWNPVTAVVGFWEELFGQVVALSKLPFDLARGSSDDERVLKGAKEVCASEGLEIAMYKAIERLARSVGDDETAAMAASILAEEEEMLERVTDAIPALTEAVIGVAAAAPVASKPSQSDASTDGPQRRSRNGHSNDGIDASEPDAGDVPMSHGQDPTVAREESAAAEQAARIGGVAPSDTGDPAMDPVYQAGGGEQDGWEAAEEELIENATHGDGHGDPELDAFAPERESARAGAVYGEGDDVDSTEVLEDPST